MPSMIKQSRRHVVIVIAADDRQPTTSALRRRGNDVIAEISAGKASVRENTNHQQSAASASPMRFPVGIVIVLLAYSWAGFAVNIRKCRHQPRRRICDENRLCLFENVSNRAQRLRYSDGLLKRRREREATITAACSKSLKTRWRNRHHY